MGFPEKHVFDKGCFHFISFYPEIFGLIKKNRLSVTKNNDEATVNMEQQNPLENKESPNIQRGKSRFSNVYSIFAQEILVILKKTFCHLS